MGLGLQPQQEHFETDTLIYVWKQYFQLLNWHRIVTYIIILTLFLENCQFNHKLAPLWHHMSSYWKTILSLAHHMTKYEGKGTKISIFKLFNELGKIWKCNIGFSKIPISHLLWIGKSLEIYRAPNQHFKIPMLNLWMSF